MRKTVIVVLVLFMLLTSSCFFMSREPKFDEGYEDIEQHIIEKYGDYLNIHIYEDGDIILSLKKSYLSDENTYSKVPEYVLIEDIRVMVNEYIDANPNSVLSNDAKEKSMSIILTARLGSHSEKLFVVDNWHNNYGNGAMKCEPHFGTYWEIDFSAIHNRISDSYISDMYDYIAQSGDVSYIQILCPGTFSEEEEKEWKEDIMDKFPLMEEYVEHD